MNFNPPKATDALRNPEKNLRHEDKTEHEKVYINEGVIFESGIHSRNQENVFQEFLGKR